jgi:hypothetical protein
MVNLVSRALPVAVGLRIINMPAVPMVLEELQVPALVVVAA